LVRKSVSDVAFQREHAAARLVEWTFVTLDLTAPSIGMDPDPTLACDSPAFHLQDEHAFSSEENEIDLASPLGLMPGQAKRMEANPVVGRGGVPENIEETPLRRTTNRLVDG